MELESDLDDSQKKILALSREHGLSAIQRILLGHDGSMTRLLELASGHQVFLHTLKQVVIPCPADISKILQISPQERVNEREIVMKRDADDRPLLHAISYTPLSRLEKRFRSDLMKADIPIGRLMQRYNMEARREITEVGLERENERLSHILDCEGPFLWRSYIIFKDEIPLITIHESFSTDVISSAREST